MVEMYEIFDATLTPIGSIPITARDRVDLSKGLPITVVYHTPRMFGAMLERRNRQFEIIERDGRFIVSDGEQAKRYIALNADVQRALKQPEKWIDPDAESTGPVR